MGNKHGKWSPEALQGWTRHSEERYTLISTRRVRARYASRRALRRRSFLETIDEERIRAEDYASDTLLILRETEPDAPETVPLETVPAPDVTQPAALTEQNPKEAPRETERIQEAKPGGREQPDPRPSSLAEGPTPPCGDDQSKRRNSTPEKELYYFYHSSQCSEAEEAKIVKVSVWNVDDMTPEGHTVVETEEQPFGCKGRAAEEEILAAVECGIDALHCKDEAQQRRGPEEINCSQEATKEPHGVWIPQESPQVEITTDEEAEDSF